LYMVIHQAPGVYAAVIFGSLLCLNFKEISIVAEFVETGSAVVASQDEVPGDARDGQTGSARHAENLRI